METLDRLVKKYVKKVMETSSAMLAKLNADMDKEEDDIAETQRVAENLEKLIEACRRSKRAQKTAKWPLRTATTVKMPKNWLFPLLKIPFTAQGGICVLMLSPAVKLKEYVEVLKLTADEEIHRLFFM